MIYIVPSSPSGGFYKQEVQHPCSCSAYMHEARLQERPMSIRLGSATKVSTYPLRHCLHFPFRFRPALQAERLSPYLVRRLLHNPIVNTGCMTLMFLLGLMWINMGPRGTCTGHVGAAETKSWLHEFVHGSGVVGARWRVCASYKDLRP